MFPPGSAMLRWSVALAAWLAFSAIGFAALWRYGNVPGDAGAPVSAWPEESKGLLDASRPTLVMFAHPRCPCTDASMAELERLQARHEGAFATRIVFYEPEDAPSSWRETRLWRRARRLPDAACIPDPGGRLALTVGAQTSGTVGLYEPGATLRFWGGVTASRGHEGDNLGVDALASMLAGRTTESMRTSIYGCPLVGSCDLNARMADGSCDDQH